MLFSPCGSKAWLVYLFIFTPQLRPLHANQNFKNLANLANLANSAGRFI